MRIHVHYGVQGELDKSPVQVDLLQHIDLLQKESFF